jgi:hypothetical protein
MTFVWGMDVADDDNFYFRVFKGRYQSAIAHQLDNSCFLNSDLLMLLISVFIRYEKPWRHFVKCH